MNIGIYKCFIIVTHRVLKFMHMNIYYPSSSYLLKLDRSLTFFKQSQSLINAGACFLLDKQNVFDSNTKSTQNLQPA